MKQLICLCFLWLYAPNIVLCQGHKLYDSPWQADPILVKKILASVPNQNRTVKSLPADSTIPLRPGWPVKVGLWPQFPAAVDLDNDGLKEIIVADMSGYLHVFRADGSYFSNAWPKQVSTAALASQAVADIDNDNGYEIVVVEQTKHAADYWPYAQIYTYDADGNDVEGWPALLSGGHLWINNASIGDVNNDGMPEVITADGSSYISGGVTTFYKKIYAFNGHGALLPGWPAEPESGPRINRTPRSPLVLVDLDGDSFLEIITGYLDVEHSSEGVSPIYALRYDGTVQPGHFPVNTSVLNYALAAADMNGDGQYEIYSHGWRINADGSIDTGWKKQEWVISKLAFADVDHDGLPELIYGTSDKGEVYVVDSNGDPLPGWPVRTRGEDGDIVDGNPVAGDIDGDGEIEILIGSYMTNHVFAWNHDGTLVDGFPVSTTAHNSRIAISDLDDDGDIELISACSDSMIYVWDIPSTGPCTNLEWPMYQHDERHTGVYPTSYNDVPEKKNIVQPDDFELLQNYPNPFNGETRIPFTLTGRANITLSIVDLRGRTIIVLEQGVKNAGRHEGVWNAEGVGSGIYLVRLQAGDVVKVRKMALTH
ncbi:T9SS type A sorting domain-containing protein [bacterium]|nr:T9SS type A sorting domain-containing protein [bacterium]